MNGILLISMGGFFGAISRFAISKKLQYSNSYPMGTLTVNFVGAFLLGLAVGLQLQGSLYSLVGIGFMGAFTTFSTLMLEAVKLNKEGKKKWYYSYLLGSYGGGIILAYSGLLLGKGL
ncbi:fluoride efflux transporter FluC [Neobacillus drentensis]|uniref:fluoride efflux transporter FluC n=1 Tax=Neobacillus drentensis TaxID=220684 RepID=UPI002FFE6B2E